MFQKDSLESILGIQGWNVKNLRIDYDSLIIEIVRKPGHTYTCPSCKSGSLIYYDKVGVRRVRDFAMSGRRCYLEFDSVRIYCSRCKKVLTESLPWVGSHRRMTYRYEEHVARLCDYLPVMDVCDLEGLDKNTVYKIDRRYLTLRERHRIKYPVKYLGIDEIAIKKGHKYATLFYDLERREVIGMVKGRAHKDVNKFFKRFGKRRCKNITAVCMDLWSAYKRSVHKYCPNAKIVFDKFHVYSYLSEAVDKVRKAEQSKAEEEGKQIIKGSRWLLLKHEKSLKEKEKTKLADLMILNENLQKAHLLKEEFSVFFESADKEAAEKFLKEWLSKCKESGLIEFEKLSKKLKRFSGGLFTYFECRITNAVSEGINNKIKVLKRRSYGFHDFRYFYLKILNITGALPPLKTVTHYIRE